MRQKTSEGFTIVELMVTMAVMAVILLIATAFFRNQSQLSGTTTKDRSARQGITLALVQLQRDLVQAGYGMPLYPQGALCFGDNNTASQTHKNVNPKDPNFNTKVYGTLWVSYGDYILNSIPTNPLSTPTPHLPYSMWPSLVYNLTPMSNTNLAGGSFSIPAAESPSGTNYTTAYASATTYANSIGAIIYWPGAGLYGSGAVTVNTPGNPTNVGTGQTMTAPPSGVVAQFTVPTAPGGTFSFAPAVVYNFVPGVVSNKTTGYITRNQQTWLGDRSLDILDFQVRALYGVTGQTTQQWAPTNLDFTQYMASSLRYVEIKIVYMILDSDSTLETRYTQFTAGEISAVTKTLRVSPRIVVLSTYTTNAMY